MPESAPPPPSLTEGDIRQLLADPNRIALVAQPIVDLHRGAIVGYETLARFKLEPFAPPDRVFAAAARVGLAEDLEAAVVERALALSLQKPPNTFLAINIDPEHVAAPKVQKLLEARGDLGGLVFELTEHRVVQDLPVVIDALADMRKRGAFVAVDDAGAGYSGLKHILEVRPHFLKLDRELVTNVHDDEAKRALIEMLGELAGRLDAWVLAEGIETELELRTLCQLGIPLGQGYFLARPSPPWCTLAPNAERSIAAAPHRAVSTTTIEFLVELCTLCVETSDWPETTRVCVRVNGEGRPLEMRVNEGTLRTVRSAHDLLRVKRESTLRDVALRATTRPERLRWDPIVCVDDRGNFVGVITLERIVGALADRAELARHPSSNRTPSGRRSLEPRS
jgi:EAL domain-containing protein (putative c-di-GMP-specific phosphodiesterase class I)